VATSAHQQQQQQHPADVTDDDHSDNDSPPPDYVSEAGDAASLGTPCPVVGCVPAPPPYRPYNVHTQSAGRLSITH